MTSPTLARPMLKRLYEWGVVADVGGRPRRLPAGVTNLAPQAQALMLEALDAVPGGVPATGWVTELDFIWDSFDRQQTSVLVMRDPPGAMLWLAGRLAGCRPVPARAAAGFPEAARLPKRCGSPLEPRSPCCRTFQAA